MNGPAPSAEPRTVEVSPLAVVNIVLRQRRLVLGVALLAALIVTVVTLVSRRTWSSASILMPQARKVPASLSGLASQLGLALPGLEASQTPAFYADLLVSREVLEAAVDTTYRGSGDGGKDVTLAWLLRARGSSDALKRDDAIRRLAKRLRVGANSRTGLVELVVTVPDPMVAQAVNARLLQRVDEFNRLSRQSQARAERQFIERRLEEVRLDLRQAEDDLQAFLQRNLAGLNMPELSFRRDRYQRQLTLQQQLYNTLTQSYEQAKLEEVRDTPVITIVQAPEVPVRPDPLRLVAKLALALALGSLVGVLAAFLRESMRRRTAGSQTEYEEFLTLRQQVASELRLPQHWLRSARGASEGRGREPS